MRLPISIVILLCCFTILTIAKKPKKLPKRILKKPSNKYEYYTPPPKTKECIEREQTILIINLYTGFLNLTQNLFAITQQQADEFKDLVTEHEMIRRPPVKPCTRKLPRFAQCKFDEVAYILRKTQCNIDERPQTDDGEQDGKDDDADNYDEDDDEHYGDDDYVRKKRSIEKRVRRSADEIDDHQRSSRQRRQTLNGPFQRGQIIRHSDGSSTRIRECYARGSSTENQHLRMSKECAATTTLPDNRFPRFLNEVYCDFSDSECLTNEGANIQRKININFRIDVNRTLGVARLGSWQTYTQEIRTSCNCQIRQSSFIRPWL